MAHRLSILLLLLATLAAHGQQQDTLSSAERWYTTQYAPLYADKPWEHAEAIAGHFTEKVRVHSETVEDLDSLEWISAALEEWRASGWTHSEIAAIESRFLNPTTVYFITRWRDHFADGSAVFDCTWYLVDFVNDSWKISSVAGTACDATEDVQADSQRDD